MRIDIIAWFLIIGTVVLGLSIASNCFVSPDTVKHAIIYTERN